MESDIKLLNGADSKVNVAKERCIFSFNKYKLYIGKIDKERICRIKANVILGMLNGCVIETLDYIVALCHKLIKWHRAI